MATTRPRRQRSGRGASGGFQFLVVLGLWAFIGWALVFDQALLAEIWNEFRELHVLLQITGWILFLPWLGAIAIWGADWERWLRILLISLIALFTLVGFAPKSRG